MGTVIISTEEYKELLCKNCNTECKKEVKVVEEEIEENRYIVFNNKEQIEKYYNANTNTYEFVKDGNLPNVKFNFNLDTNGRNINARNIYACNINARNINACDIDAYDINACDIDAYDINAYDINACDINACNINARNIGANNINACNISYHAYCIVTINLRCKGIEGRRGNSIHKCLDKEIEYIN